MQNSRQSTLPVDVLDNYPIFNNLCSHLEIAAILPLMRVTKRWLPHLSAHLKERWNINKKLLRFVENPVALRTQLGCYNALISGSFALQFFDGVVWDESDLDIYVEHQKGDTEIGEYLTKAEGYELRKTKHIEDDEGYFRITYGVSTKFLIPYIGSCMSLTFE